MTSHAHHQLDQLRLEWRSLQRSRASREAAALLIDEHVELAAWPISDLGDVVDLLEPGGPLSQLERSRLAALLLESCPRDPLIQRALLQTLLPGIVGVARRLGWGRRSGEDPAVFLADLVTTAFEVIDEWGGQQRPYAAPDLLNAVRCRMRRRLASEAMGSVTPLERPDGSVVELPAEPDDDPLESIKARLESVAHEVDPVGAAALYGREVLGLSYRELAEMTGVSPRQLASKGREVARRILW